MPFPLLSDYWPHGAVGKANGVFNEERGMDARAVFLVDAQGIIRHCRSMCRVRSPRAGPALRLEGRSGGDGAMKCSLRAAGALALIASCGSLFAQAPYPSKPIRIVVPYPAGPSGADGLARLLGPKLSE